jgi:Leucine-rich repeat (LRR) protein
MDNSRVFFQLILFFFSINTAFAQKSVPYFRNTEDSLKYIETTRWLGYYYSQKEPESVDSLQKVISNLVAGYKYTYTPSRGFVSLKEISQSQKPDTFKLVYIDGKDIIEVPKTLKLCKDLETLELVNTSIEIIPGWLKKNKKLKKISIYNNKIKSGGELLVKRNKRVRKIEIKGMDETNVIHSFARFPKLEEALFFDCNLGKLPERLHKNKKLEKLRFVKSQFKTEPDFESNNKKIKIQKVGFYECGLTQLPGNLDKFQNLKSLWLVENKFEQIPAQIQKLKNLETLSFYKNKIKELPEELFSLTNLKEIDLYHNEISVLPVAVKNLNNLEILYLSFNNLYSIPEEIGELSNLKQLFIHHNKLSYLPESIGNLHSLEILHFNNNYFQSFPFQIFKLPKLYDLNLSANSFTDIPLERFRFPALKHLYLFKNPFDTQFLDSEQFQTFISELEENQVNVKY